MSGNLWGGIKINNTIVSSTFIKNLQTMYVHQNPKGTKQVRQLGYDLDSNNFDNFNLEEQLILEVV